MSFELELVYDHVVVEKSGQVHKSAVGYEDIDGVQEIPVVVLCQVVQGQF